MKRQYYFYVLKDPILKEIRYFGRTINPIKRLKDHVYESKNCDTHKCNWIKSLPNDPILEVVYKELCTIEESKQIEKSILRKLMRRFNLTNSWDNCLGAHKTGKLVHQYDLQGNFIKTYQNSNHASTEVNISDSNILRTCKKASSRGAVRAGNYYWLFDKFKIYPYKLTINKGEKAIVQLDLDNNIIKEYASAREASKILNIGYKLISQVCNGNKKQTHGYRFQFK